MNMIHASDGSLMSLTHLLPGFPPHASQATRPGEGKPGSPCVNPVALASTSWRAKYERILRMVSSETSCPSASWRARVRPVAVNPEPA